MKRRWGSWISVLLALLMIAGLVACDSSSSGGGGTADTGYTQSMLTGTWRVVFDRVTPAPTVFAMHITLDSAGRITEYKIVHPVSAKIDIHNVRGALIVYPDGRVEGTLTNLVVQGAVVQTSKSVYRLKFHADGTISGSRSSVVRITNGGVLVGNTAIEERAYWERR